MSVQLNKAMREPQIEDGQHDTALTLFYKPIIAKEGSPAAHKNHMEKAEFLLPLPDGRLASCEMILSPFSIYISSKHPNLYIFVPNSDQDNLNGIIVIASETAIRICYHKGWPQMLVSKVRNLSDCKHSDVLTQIQICHIPTDVQFSICSNLIKSIKFN